MKPTLALTASFLFLGFLGRCMGIV